VGRAIDIYGGKDPRNLPRYSTDYGISLDQTHDAIRTAIPAAA
jgi:hypothetical protein